MANVNITTSVADATADTVFQAQLYSLDPVESKVTPLDPVGTAHALGPRVILVNFSTIIRPRLGERFYVQLSVTNRSASPVTVELPYRGAVGTLFVQRIANA